MGSKKCEVVLDVAEIVDTQCVLDLPPGIPDLSPFEKPGVEERSFADALAVVPEEDVAAETGARALERHQT